MTTTLSFLGMLGHRVKCDCGHNEIHALTQDAVDDYSSHHCPTEGADRD